ncbi:MAG: hypothetical protein ABJ215_04770 [Alphaproteobacteria bacterium]
MKLPDGQVVELLLVSGDDTLAVDFIAELEERSTTNPVTHLKTFQAGIDILATASGRASSIVILDLRNAQREGMRFLNEVHSRLPFREPVIFIIGAEDFEAEIMKDHARFIAGQLPETGAGAAFVEWAASMLAENWSFESSPQKN